LNDAVAGMVHRRMATLPTKPFVFANAQVKMACLEVDSLFGEVDVIPALDLPDLPLDVGPADAADAVRRAWRIASGPLPNLVNLIESAGIPVLLLDSFHEKHSGASHRGRWFEWMIALNGNHPPSRRRFTLAHDLGHIALKHEASAALDDDAAKLMEAEADAFAASLLLPESDARRELRNIDFRRLVTLKQRWKVSIAFLIHQAYDFELIDSTTRQWLYIQLGQQPGGRRREPAEFESESPSLVRKMIETLQADGLSVSDIADLVTADELTFRSRYLGENALRLMGDRPARVKLELQRPDLTDADA
jgi:Zn-dependent peptidase ImmA (M78 family)